MSQQKEPKTASKKAKLSARTRLMIFLLGWEPWRRPGSRRRKVISRILVYLCGILILEVCWSQWKSVVISWPIFATFGSIIALSFFVYQLLVIPLLTSTSFQIDARRMFLNAMISTLFTILTFSQLYRVDGLSGDGTRTAFDFVYFSAVTFSTLGFGDLSPATTAGRMAAAIQAIVGNLHLAVIVGAMFLRMSRRSPDQVS